jgi:AcrR family transcriptional regulator
MSIEIEAPVMSARDRILSVAGPLFYREGYRAIGVDRVIAEADVAKATFYRHFPSKDDLIIAWINKAEAGSGAMMPAADTPTALTDFVSAIMATARRPACTGCTFQGSAAEYGQTSHPVHAAARAVKDRALADLETRARAEGLSNPADVAAEVFLVIEGLWASTRMFGHDAPFAAAERAFARIIAAAR